MIVLDTNVLSEPLRPRPSRVVIEWLAEQHDVAISAISVGELLRGVAILPVGRKRDAVAEAIDSVLHQNARRVLPYDSVSARAYAAMYGGRRAAGKPLALEDGMIAASAFVNGAVLATRNVSDFEGLGIDLINPWD